MRTKRLFPLLLAILLLTGCGSGTVETDTQAPESDTVAATETTPAETDRSQVQDALPELDYGGLSVPILYRGCTADVIEVFAEELTGESVSDAVYNRNASVSERLNISLEFLPMGTGTADNFPKDAKASITAGSDDFSIVSWNQFSAVQLCLENMVMDLQNAPYIDLEKPWWNSAYMDVLQIGDQKRFYLMGDICLNALRVTAATFFNQSIYSDVFGDHNELYTLVQEGGWTIDAMREMSETAYRDVDGNGETNPGDVFGIAATTIANTELLAYGAGLQIVVRDTDGMPKLNLQDEKNFSILEKLNELYWNTTGMYTKYGDTDAFNSAVLANVFAADELLFMPLWLKTCEYLRDMESAYGILPYPKYDIEQAQYISTVQDTASIFFVPQTCLHRDETCAVLEAMCAETYRTVTPAYYEVALKRQYARDDISASMIDLIHNTSMTDFGYVYNYSIGSVGTIMRDVIAKNGSYASAVASMETKADTALDKLIETYIGE